ncbi:MAG: O-antigen ligase family protein, partial [Deltaproteobacteria bacterium]|nr:O-antigen ligase family protein [Deltaproteobacteria bacterium]
PWLAAPWALAAAASALALCPLPAWLRGLLDADGAERVLRAAALLPSEAATLVRPVLAWEPTEAALSLLRTVGALAVVVVVAQGAARSSPRRLAYRVLSVGALVLVAVAAAGALRDPAQTREALSNAASALHGPLYNPNQLGKVFAFFALLCTGRALSIRLGGEVALHVVAGLLCALCAVLTDSRGAILALAMGAVVLGVLLALRRARVSTDRVGPLLGGAGALAVLGAALLTTLGAHAVASLAPLDPEGAAKSKVSLWPWAWELVQSAPPLGVAPGAFRVAFPSILEPGQPYGSRFSYSHVESVVLQTLLDRGPWLGTLLIALAAWCAWRIGRSGAAMAAPGATAAVATLLFGELLDFVTELPAGALLLGVGVGLVVARTRGVGPAAPLTPRRGALVCVGLVALTGLVAPVALRDWPHRVDLELRELRGTERLEALQRAFARHPSNGQYAYELAVAARNRRDPRGALVAAERAQALWPALRGPHVEAARALAALGRTEQAIVEYRVAWRCGLADAELLLEVVERFAGYAERRRAVPDEPAALAHLCGALQDRKEPAQAQRCLDELGALPGASPEQRGAPIRYALAQGDVAGAVSRADLAMRVATPDGAVAAEAARAIASRDGAVAALAHTRDWPARLADPRPLLLWRTLAAQEAGELGAADEALAALRRAAQTPGDVDVADRTEAAVLQVRGRLAEAHRLVERLAGRAPADVELGAWQARLEGQLGLPSQAQATARRLLRAWPDDARVRALAAEVGVVP